MIYGNDLFAINVVLLSYERSSNQILPHIQVKTLLL